MAEALKTEVMSVRATVLQTLAQVGKEQNRVMPALVDELTLVDCGLDSLGLAVVVARLEETLGVDPFGDAATFPVTILDFVQLYEHAAG